MQNLFVLRFQVHKVGLDSPEAWAFWSKTDERPESIPISPNISYMDKGWSSWVDWLGVSKDPAFVFWKVSGGRANKYE